MKSARNINEPAPERIDSSLLETLFEELGLQVKIDDLHYVNLDSMSYIFTGDVVFLNEHPEFHDVGSYQQTEIFQTGSNSHTRVRLRRFARDSKTTWSISYQAPSGNFEEAWQSNISTKETLKQETSSMSKPSFLYCGKALIGQIKRYNRTTLWSPTLMYEYAMIQFAPSVLVRAGQSNNAAADYLHQVVATHATDGWEYQRCESFSIVEAPGCGCFSMFSGAQPREVSVYVAVFRRPITNSFPPPVRQDQLEQHETIESAPPIDPMST